ncbi:teicoplanin resistance protein VanZ [Clostridium botulinum]|uniref:teicoplanin resistance protein VanZ n=1 Tax=Clostridium botulinum TaxID=1491 RepID=UPI003DA6B257
MRIILTSKPEFQGYSIEAGKGDNIKHFDHHGQFENYPSPCNNNQIPVAEEDSIIEITHMDADTYVGILRLLGKDLPNINLEMLEQIDNNGSSICRDKYNPALLYQLGIGRLQRNLKIPRVSEERVDVTHIIEEMFNYSTKKIINIGEEVQESSEEAYIDYVRSKKENKILFSINAQDNLNPSRAYEDDYDIVVVYRKHYKTISIYCNPKSQYAFAGKEVAGIKFDGHPQACGSPRGMEMTEEQALKVWEEI